MKKFLAVLMMSLMTLSTIAEARSSFSGGRSSFSSSRSYSSPSRSYNTPRYTAPRPVVRKTTVVNQHVTQNNSSTGGGLGFFGTLLATGAGSYVGNKLAQPSQPEAPQYPICPAVIPAGWNTPCIPLQQSQGK